MEWHCLAHESPEWEAARAMGAGLPCRIPLADPDLVALASAGPLPPSTIRIMARQVSDDERLLTLLIANDGCPPDVRTDLLRRLTPGGQRVLGRQCSAELLRLIATFSSHVRVGAVENTTCPVDLFVAFAGSSDASLRLSAALSPLCPPPALKLLGRDPDAKIRAAVAAHPMCPRMVLSELVHDSEPLVRRGIRERSG